LPSKLLNIKTKFPILKTVRFGLIFMVVFVGFQTLIIHRMGWDWKISFTDAFFSVGLLVFFCLDILTIFTFYQPSKSNYIYRFLFVIAFTVLYGITLKWTLSWFFSDNDVYLNFLLLSMPVRAIFTLVICLFVVVLHWMWNNLMEQREKEKRNEDMEQLAKDAELATLRQKLQPHFLFNSLNSISALAASKPEQARTMIQQLSDFLRGTLKKDEQKFIALKDELAHLQLYLEIEKVRFGHRLSIETDFNEQCNDLVLPPLLIQPIVENAIKFGLYDTLGGTVISIYSHCENKTLIIEVRNPFDSTTQQANAGTGFGLSSIQRRLFLLYSRNDLLTTEKKDNLFITTLKLPQFNV
jgi:two-component system LytT family sensor kinase